MPRSAGGETEAGVGEAVCQRPPGRDTAGSQGAWLALGQEQCWKQVMLFVPGTFGLGAEMDKSVHCALCTKQKQKWKGGIERKGTASRHGNLRVVPLMLTKGLARSQASISESCLWEKKTNKMSNKAKPKPLTVEIKWFEFILI